MTRTAQPTPLSDRELDVLRDLAACRPDAWMRPMDVGGRDASHHSYTLGKLVRRGLAESTSFVLPWGGRGSKRYRITEAGRRVANGSSRH